MTVYCALCDQKIESRWDGTGCLECGVPIHEHHDEGLCRVCSEIAAERSDAEERKLEEESYERE